MGARARGEPAFKHQLLLPPPLLFAASVGGSRGDKQLDGSLHVRGASLKASSPQALVPTPSTPAASGVHVTIRINR